MSAKHTPGPWQMSGGRSRHDVYGHMVGPDGYGVAIVAYSDRKPGEHTASLADARLIAAAPRLLEALKLLLETPPGYTPERDRAIAIAETLLAELEGS